MPRKSNPLSSYRAKRTLERTPEPAGSVPSGSGTTPGGLFVVHKHAARRLHFDLRLEMEGVLRSWAVPKGPSYDPRDKRLAVLVEDHPLEYGEFEGLIPEGNYGAGAVIVWDRGRWEPVEDPLEGLASGKLLFQLHGLKLRGLWTLVKLKKGEAEWLLIKERDGFAISSDEAAPPPEESVLSGLTVEDLKAGRTPAEGIRAELRRLNAPNREVSPASVRLMLAESRVRPFTAPGWLFELKLDGYRAVAARDGSPRLLSRNGNDLAGCFPEVVQALRALPYDRLVMDGELVTLDDGGKPSFQRLQQRAQLRRPIDIRHAAVQCPVTYYAFDLLAFEDFDLRGLSLLDRKALLRRVIPPAGVIRFLDHFADDGEVLYQQVQKLGLEGIVAKRSDAPYKPGRSAIWLKIRTRRTDDFVVVGFTAPKGNRAGFGALHLACYQDGQLTYSGRAGSGFTEQQLIEVRRTLEELVVQPAPCRGTLPDGDGTRWVEPRLVCEVEFTEWTEEGLLRQPVFLRFRDDKSPAECVVSREAGKREGGEVVLPEGRSDKQTVTSPNKPEAGKKASAGRREPRFEVTNEKKIFWPENGYTKGDLIAYYKEVARWILPYLADRPVVLTRYPDGIAGKSFYQMDAPGFVPDWMRTERMWSEQAQREIDYFICDDEDSLLYLVNLGTIPLHVWGSRIASIGNPDWCVLDLDPKEAPFTEVVTVAEAAHALCQDVGLPSFVKTSGSSGLHVMIPLGAQCRHDQARSLGELLARLITAELPEICTLTRQVSHRGGKVYVDYLQNGSGRLIVAPFSVRPLPGAPVSMPLKWSEVNSRLDIRHFTIANVAERMRKLKRDPLKEVLSLAPDIGAALERVAQRPPRQ